MVSISNIIIAVLIGILVFIIIRRRLRQDTSKSSQHKSNQNNDLVLSGPPGVGKTSLFLRLYQYGEQGPLPFPFPSPSPSPSPNLPIIPTTTLSAQTNVTTTTINNRLVHVLDVPFHLYDEMEAARQVIIMLDGLRSLSQNEVSWLIWILAQCIRKKLALLILVSKADLIDAKEKVAMRLQDDINRQLAERLRHGVKEEEEEEKEQEESRREEGIDSVFNRKADDNLTIIRKALQNHLQRPFDKILKVLNTELWLYSKDDSKALNQIVEWISVSCQ